MKYKYTINIILLKTLNIMFKLIKLCVQFDLTFVFLVSFLVKY